MKAKLSVLIALLLCLSTSCHIMRVDTRENPPGVSSRGLIDGHLVFGFSEEDSIIRADLFDRSGTIIEFGIWKLFRIEVGLAGAAIGVGPIDMGIGIGFYKPSIPFGAHDPDIQIIDIYENPDGTTTRVKSKSTRR